MRWQLWEARGIGGIPSAWLEALAQDLKVFKLAPPLALLAYPLEYAPVQHLIRLRVRVSGQGQGWD